MYRTKAQDNRLIPLCKLADAKVVILLMLIIITRMVYKVSDALRWNMNAGWNEVAACPFPYFIIKFMIIFHNK